MERKIKMDKNQEQSLLYYPYLDDNNICYSHCTKEMETIISSVRDGHDAKKAYIIDPLMVKTEDEGYALPYFSINTLDGVTNAYNAEIEPELLNRLYIVLAKCCLNLVMKPIGVLADMKSIKFLCFSSKQSDIINDTFAGYAGFDTQKPILLN